MVVQRQPPATSSVPVVWRSGVDARAVRADPDDEVGALDPLVDRLEHERPGVAAQHPRTAPVVGLGLLDDARVGGLQRGQARAESDPAGGGDAIGPQVDALDHGVVRVDVDVERRVQLVAAVVVELEHRLVGGDPAHRVTGVLQGGRAAVVRVVLEHRGARVVLERDAEDERAQAGGGDHEVVHGRVRVDGVRRLLGPGVPGRVRRRVRRHHRRSCGLRVCSAVRRSSVAASGWAAVASAGPTSATRCTRSRNPRRRWTSRCSR